MATFAKPENALKRAEELMNVGQKAAALQALHDLITSKRYRAWQKPLEKIMFKYVELCVDMRRGRFAKDGLIQYRIACQQVNVSSLEEVIKHFMHLSTERAEQAQAQAEAAVVTFDVEDLEAEKTPEDLMLSYVSGEKGKERSDRELVTPWFKFLWETYRTVLEILRNNSKLESLYAMTAHRAFQFCLQYKRTTEFRRLCEILRNHLANLSKYRDQRDRPDLTLPESLQLYLDTRLEQLKVATELELWQEAFRTIEDIHGLMSMVKKSPKPQMMAIYYAKLIKIFWVSRSHLYHGYAWYKLYNLQKSYNKNLTPKDLQLMASSVLLSTISVQPYDRKHGAHHFELEIEKDRNVRMANLLGFSLDPKRDNREVLSRSALLSDLISKGVLTYVLPEVKDLYSLLENEFNPLDLAAKVQPLLSKLPKLGDKLSAASPVPEVSLEDFIPALQDLTTLRVLQQVSQVYQTMRISNLSKMIPFYSFSVVEKLAVDAAKYNFVQMKIDHGKGVVHFGSQDLESDKIKNHLTILAKRLNKAVGLIQLPFDRIKKPEQRFADLLSIVEKDHKRLLARKVIIEKRKEDQEKQILEAEREEEIKRQQKQRSLEDQERLRLQRESEQRVEERVKREIEEKEIEDAKLLLEKQKGRLKKKTIDLDKPKTKEAIMQQVLLDQKKEREELDRKLQKLAKTMDHFERAKREEERPLIQNAFLKRQEDDRVYFEEQQKLAVEQSRLQHSEDLQEKDRLSRMIHDKEYIQNEVLSRRKGELERQMRVREERIAEERSLRKQERDRRRKMEYYRIQEEERLEQEAARKKQEEERRKIEEAERKAKLDEIAAKQRQREAEAEERVRKERESILEKSSLFTPSAARKDGGALPRASQPFRARFDDRPPAYDERPRGFDDRPSKGFDDRQGRGFDDRRLDDRQSRGYEPRGYESRGYSGGRDYGERRESVPEKRDGLGVPSLAAPSPAPTDPPKSGKYMPPSRRMAQQQQQQQAPPSQQQNRW